MTTTLLYAMAVVLAIIAVLIVVHWRLSRRGWAGAPWLRVFIGVLQMVLCQVLAAMSVDSGNIGSACLWTMGAGASLLVNLPFPESKTR